MGLLILFLEGEHCTCHWLEVPTVVWCCSWQCFSPWPFTFCCLRFRNWVWVDTSSPDSEWKANSSGHHSIVKVMPQRPCQCLPSLWDSSLRNWSSVKYYGAHQAEGKGNGSLTSCPLLPTTSTIFPSPFQHMCRVTDSYFNIRDLPIVLLVFLLCHWLDRLWPWHRV